MRKTLSILLAAGILSVAAPSVSQAQTQTQTQTNETASADSTVMERKKALIARYFKAINFDAMMDQMMKSMIPAMMDQMRRSNPKFTAEMGDAVSEAVVETMAEFMPDYIDAAMNLYAETLTEEELVYLVEFYESPTGQSIMHKSMQLMPQISQLMFTKMPDINARVVEKLCAKIDCNAS